MRKDINSVFLILLLYFVSCKNDTKSLDTKKEKQQQEIYNKERKDVLDATDLIFFYPLNKKVLIKNYLPYDILNLNKNHQKTKIRNIHTCTSVTYNFSYYKLKKYVNTKGDTMSKVLNNDNPKFEYSGKMICFYNKNGYIEHSIYYIPNHIDEYYDFYYDKSNNLVKKVSNNINNEINQNTSLYKWDTNNNIIKQSNIPWNDDQYYKYNENGIIEIITPIDNFYFNHDKILLNSNNQVLESLHAANLKGNNKCHGVNIYDTKGRLKFYLFKGNNRPFITNHYFYDNKNQLVKEDSSDDNSTSINYYYDKNGNTIKIETIKNNIKKFPNCIESYTTFIYDENNMLIEENLFSNFSSSDKVRPISKTIYKYSYFK